MSPVTIFTFCRSHIHQMIEEHPNQDYIYTNYKVYSLRMCLALYISLAVGLLAVLHWCRDKWLHSRWVPDLHKKAVFITGCDSGFGFETAVSLDSKGVLVFAGCLTDEGAKKLRARCSSRLQTLSLDVTKQQMINAAYDKIKADIPKGCVLWGVVNNAGVIMAEGPTEFYTEEDYRRIYEVNFLSMTNIVKTFLPLLRRSRGRVINMGSISGAVHLPRLAPYVTSKAAVVAYTDLLRMENSIWDVHAAVILPGGFGTNIVSEDVYRKAKERQWDNLALETQLEYGRKQFDKATEAVINWKKNDATPDLSPVVGAYESALFSQRPRAHYIPDTQGWLLYALSWLPRRLLDTILIQQMVTPDHYMPQAKLKSQ